MRHLGSTVTLASLFGLGVLLCTLTASPLQRVAELKTPPNPLGLKRSPYGEVVAMAMQGSIDTNFLISIYGVKLADPNSAQAPSDTPAKRLQQVADNPGKPFARQLQSVLEEMRQGHEKRTNPVLASETLKRFLRRKAEDKLRLAYDLDPSHYANYNALHFFLAEHISTRPEMIPMAGSLAQDTIAYCMTRPEDPQALLTASAAYGNLLQLMFQKRADGTHQAGIHDMERCLAGLDHAIGLYLALSDRWLETGEWNRLSGQRVEECQERILYISRMREIAAETLLRIKKGQVMQNSLKSGERSE
ncbi:MAG TPA: hypothetical protein VFY13_08320 [Luteolibacter sp.]|nr:hypothetical protein [Luteolibacter sp.]